MNTENGWQAQFEHLGKVLSERPRLASRVLQQIEQRRDRLTATPSGQVALRRSCGNLRWTAAGLSTLAAGLLVAFWIFSGSESLAFAQVQAALLEIKTVIIERRSPDTPKLNHRVLVSAKHDLFRLETENDVVVIQSREGKKLTLNTKLRIAQVTPGAGFGLEGEDQSPQDLLLSLQNVQTAAVKSLGTKTFDGRELVGFELPAGYEARRIVWVDPNTHLPVREEISPQEQSSADAPMTEVRLRRTDVKYQFDVEISDDLFSLEMPDGYQLVQGENFEMPGMELPDRPAGADASNYVITPGQGIGRLHFGMTKQEVVAVLGEPDSVEQFGGLTADQQQAMDEMERKAKDENWDTYKLNREMNRMVNSSDKFVRAGDALFYRSLGFWVSVRDDNGVNGFTCSHKTGVFQMFAGTTDRGISMNSTLADVRRVYGEPSETHEPNGMVIAVYKDLMLSFTFGVDGRMKEISLYPLKDQQGQE